MFMIWVVRSRISTIFSILALDSFSALGVGRGGCQGQGVQEGIHSAFRLDVGELLGVWGGAGWDQGSKGVKRQSRECGRSAGGQVCTGLDGGCVRPEGWVCTGRGREGGDLQVVGVKGPQSRGLTLSGPAQSCGHFP